MIVVTRASRSIASACLTSTPAAAPRPVAIMIDIGVARPSAHGQAMIRTATALTSAWASPASSGPAIRPHGERRDRRGEHRGHEVRRHHVGAPLDRRAAALRLADQRTIWASTVALPTRSARITKLRCVVVPASPPRRRHLDREPSPVTSDSSSRAGASTMTPSTGSFFARTDPQPVARTTRSIAISCSLPSPATGARCAG